jgi:hypothetical protein
MVYQQAEARDVGEGGGQGGAGEGELAEAADEQDRDGLDDLLQEERGGERRGEAQLPLDLAQRRALVDLTSSSHGAPATILHGRCEETRWMERSNGCGAGTSLIMPIRLPPFGDRFGGERRQEPRRFSLGSQNGRARGQGRDLSAFSNTSPRSRRGNLGDWSHHMSAKFSTSNGVGTETINDAVVCRTQLPVDWQGFQG